MRFKRGAMTLEQSASRMTALLARKPRKAVTRKLLATLPKREPLTVTADDYSEIISRAVAKAESRMADRDQQRYAAWEARGKPPSPSMPPRKDRRRPRVTIEGRAHVLAKLLDLQNAVCPICGGHIDDNSFNYADRGNLDHVLPRSRGGRDSQNLLATHRRCNSGKGSRYPTGCELIWLAAINARLS